MDTNQTVSQPGAQPAPAAPAAAPGQSKAMMAVVAVLGVIVLALGGALLLNKSEDSSASVAATAPGAAPKVASDSSRLAPPPVAHPAPAKHSTAPAVVAQAPKAAACASCGTVEAVTPVQRQGEVNGVAVGGTTIGLGTVAGGVVGGLLGNQVGGGNGKTAMTVLGAAGGAFAGNQIEKNMKKVTVYEVRVRMDDGSVRTMEVSSSVPVGSKVVVEGKNLRLA